MIQRSSRLQQVRRWLELHEEDLRRTLELWTSIPSTAEHPEALQEAAELISERMRRAGLAAGLFEEGDAPPFVYGERPGRRPQALIVYGQYDVPPPGPGWHFDPFSPQLDGDRLVARGVLDKGNILARLAGIQAYLEVFGELPVGVRVLLEGGAKQGSPHLPAFIHSRRSLLAGVAALWDEGGITGRGRPYLILGLKGILCVDLEVEGPPAPLHSAYATIVPNPAWQLIWALSSLKSPQEEITIEGFYDRVRGPSDEEVELLDDLMNELEDEEALRERLGVPEFLQGLTGRSLYLCHHFSPTCNISFVESGEVVEESLWNVVPPRARARIDFRLVPDQSPEEIYVKLLEHLKALGLKNVKVRRLDRGSPPTYTPPDDPFVQQCVVAGEVAFGEPPLLLPNAPVGGQMHLFRQELGIPVVGVGVARPDSNPNGPNENVRISDLVKVAFHVATLLHLMGGEG